MARTDRINLSTRPFHNERGIHVVLALAAVFVLAISAYNLWQVYVLSGRHAELQVRLSQAETKTRELRDRATAIRRSIDPRELEATVAAAREANLLIERRVFSWTEVLNQFETTLPVSVRISSVRPHIERDGTMLVEVVVLARTVEAVDAFIENLEKKGAFSGVLSREEFVNEDGLIQAALEGRYRPSVEAAPAPAAPKEAGQ
jgi:Tfp pilus assembly protein PilN